MEVTPEPIENPIQYPEKPEINHRNNLLVKSLMSIAAFIFIYQSVYDADLMQVLLLVAVIFIHEMGHFLMMLAFGYKDLKMFFIPLLGAFVSGKKPEISQKQRVIILLAGPVPGIVLGICLFFYAPWTSSFPLTLFMVLLISINIFNMVPLLPFDGGKVLQTLFFQQSANIQTVFAVISSAVMVWFAAYSESYIFLILPVMLVLSISAQKRMTKIKTELERQHISYKKSYEQLTNAEYWKIRKFVVSSSVLYKHIDPNQLSYAREEARISKTVNSILEDNIKSDLSTGGKVLFLLIWAAFFLLPILYFLDLRGII